MNPTFDAFAQSWPFDPWLIAGLVVSGAIYTRGWGALYRRNASRWTGYRLASFWAALAAVFVALGSPIEVFVGLLLQVHMVQHLILLLIVPPLVWWSGPMLPLVRGLPRPVRVAWIAPLWRSSTLRWGLDSLGHPLVALPIFVVTLWVWHVPRYYEMALAAPDWHLVEHACFLLAGLCFWYPVIRCNRAHRYSRWVLVPYLLLADVQNTVLAAWLAFASEPIYASYAAGPRVAGISALADQQAAGVWMWVPGSIALLIPLVTIGLKTLYGPRPARAKAVSTARKPGSQAATPRSQVTIVLPVLNQRPPKSASREIGWDLGRAPAVQRLLRSRWLRPTLQIGMLALAMLVVADGLFGPQITSANLAGVAPWIHWRGLLILGLLVAGNVICLACPFKLPRTLAGHWWKPRRAWPEWLQNKWLALVLVGLFLWSYEAFSLWDSPWLTAWIVLGYFLAALMVDALFRGEAFCKYVCPIGQFNFVQSLVSPWEVRVRDADRCATCTTKECIRGSESVSGCGMRLAQPRKLGNLDCTFCLNCVQACPHDNVSLMAVVGSRQLVDLAAFRSGIGRLTRRPDVAALVVLLAFGAFANAAGMIAPVIAWQDALSARLGNPPYAVVTAIYYLLALVAAPTVLLVSAAWLSRQLQRGVTKLSGHLVRACYMLVPLGFAMWLAHYSFHFVTSYGTLIPVAQRMVLDLGVADWGPPEWQRSCCAEVPNWLVAGELIALGMGLLWSLRIAYRLALGEAGSAARALRMALPGGCLLVALFATGVWIVLQPMQMRGTATVESQIAETARIP